MTETPDIAPTDPDIPDEPPPADASDPELPDQPLGVQSEAESDDAPLPGVPEAEPPASE
jgi:hypothetical protein